MPIQKILKSNLNLIVTLTQKLNESFTALWSFFGDCSFCNQRTWQLLRNFLKFLPKSPRMISWQISWFSNFVWDLYNLKLIRPHVRGHVSWMRCSNFSLNSSTMPQIGLNKMNIIFSIYYSTLFKSLPIHIWIIPKYPFQEIN